MTIRDASVGIKLEGLANAIQGVTQFNKKIDDIPKFVVVDVKTNSNIDKVLDPIKHALKKPFDVSTFQLNPKQLGINAVAEGFESINKALGRTVVSRGQITGLSNAVGPLLGGLREGINSTTGLSLGFAEVGLVAAGALAVTVVGLVEVVGFLKDGIAAAMEFSSQLGAMGRLMQATPEQMAAITESSFKIGLESGTSPDKVAAIMKTAFEANVGQTEGKAGEIDQTALDAVVERSLMTTAVTGKGTEEAVATLIGKQAQFMKTKDEDMGQFVKRTSDSIAVSASLFHASVQSQIVYMNTNSNYFKLLSDNLNGAMTQTAGTNMAGLLAAGGQTRAGLRSTSGAIQMAELTKSVMTIDPGKRAELQQAMGFKSPEELLQAQQDPAALAMNLIKQYAEAGSSGNTSKQVELAAITGQTGEGSALKTLGASTEAYQELADNYNRYIEQVKLGTIVDKAHDEEMKGLGGTLDRIATRFTTLGKAIGLTVLPFILAVASAFDVLTALLEPGIMYIQGLAAAFDKWTKESAIGVLIMQALGGAVMGVLVVALVAVALVLATVIGSIAGFIGGLVGGGAVIVGAAIAIAAIVGALVSLATHSEIVQNAWKGLQAAWGEFWNSDIGKQMAALTGGKFSIEGAGNLVTDIFKNILVRLVSWSPLISVMVYVLEKIYEVLKWIWSIAIGFADWFGNVIKWLSDLYGYFTGSFSDSQAKSYQDAKTKEGALVHPELAEKTLAEVKVAMEADPGVRTLLKDIKGAPAAIAAPVKDVAQPVNDAIKDVLAPVVDPIVSALTPADTQVTAYQASHPELNGKSDDEVKEAMNKDPLGKLEDDTGKKSITGGRFDSFVSWLQGNAEGGVVTQSGIALIHAGEPIIPAKIASNSYLQDVLGSIAEGRSSTTNASENKVINLNFDATFNISGESSTDSFTLRRTIETIVADALRHSSSY